MHEKDLAQGVSVAGGALPETLVLSPRTSALPTRRMLPWQALCVFCSPVSSPPRPVWSDSRQFKILVKSILLLLVY